MINANEFRNDKAYPVKSNKTIENSAYKYTLESVKHNISSNDEITEIRSIMPKLMALDVLVEDHKRLCNLVAEFEQSYDERKKYVDHLPGYKKYIIEHILGVYLR